MYKYLSREVSFFLTEGSKVLFLEEGDRVYLINSTMMALAELQQTFAGAAAEAGLTCEEDVIQMIKDNL